MYIYIYIHIIIHVYVCVYIHINHHAILHPRNAPKCNSMQHIAIRSNTARCHGKHCRIKRDTLTCETAH